MASDLANFIVEMSESKAKQERARSIASSSASLVYDVFYDAEASPIVKAYHLRREDDNVFRVCMDDGLSDDLPSVTTWKRYTADGLRAYFKFEGNRQNIANKTREYTRGCVTLASGTLRPKLYSEYQDNPFLDVNVRVVREMLVFCHAISIRMLTCHFRYAGGFRAVRGRRRARHQECGGRVAGAPGNLLRHGVLMISSYV